MRYSVQCSDRTTGLPYAILVEAAEPRAAIELVAAHGHLVSSSVLVVHGDLSYVEPSWSRSEKEMLAALARVDSTLRRSLILRYPLRTVAFGVAVFFVVILLALANAAAIAWAYGWLDLPAILRRS